MIVFDLKCAERHQFEVWFRSSADYEDQKTRGLLECPYCGDKQITKALMAPNVAAKSNQKIDRPPQAVQDSDGTGHGLGAVKDKGVKAKEGAEIVEKKNRVTETAPAEQQQPAADFTIPADMQEAFQEAVKKINSHVEKNFDHVGKGFAEEARRIHYGETKKRAIYGEATKEETLELIEEGVDVLPLPGVVKKDA